MQTIQISPKHTLKVPNGVVFGTPVNTRITNLAFINRFTDDEAVDIDLASIGATREAALLRRYLEKVSKASHIDLKSAQLAEDLGKLVIFGLLTEDRKNEILNTPAKENELYHGVL